MESNLYTYKAKLIRVIDGDTLEAEVDLGFKVYHKVTVRLLGVDTPEIRTKDLQEKQKGFMVKEIVESLLGEEFYIVSKELDSFGRSLAEIYTTGNLNLNQYLLEHNLAKVFKK